MLSDLCRIFRIVKRYDTKSKSLKMVQFSFSLLYAVLALSRMMSLNDTDHTKVIQIDIIIEMLV